MSQNRSEDSYIMNDVLPFLASSYGYPIHDYESVKIKDVPIFRPSGGKSGSKPDIVYYYNKEPILLIEAKRKHKSHKEALREILIYLKNFPIDYPEYAPSGLPPKILGTTVGFDIKFYKWSIDYSSPIPGFLTEEIPIISFLELLNYYGFSIGYSPRLIDFKEFKTDYFDELVAIYKKELNENKITPKVIRHTVYQIFNYLRFKDHYTGQDPYIKISLQGQKAVRDLFNRFDLHNSLGPEIAKEFRKSILRSFQGASLNQYLTEQCVIAFMLNIVGNLGKETKVLDFECGSGGFLVAVIDKGVDLNNIKGIDIDELPYIIAKTYIALYFKIIGNKEIESLPIKQENGLFFQGSDWDLVISNPAGGNKYKNGELDEIGENLNLDLDNSGKIRKSFSEYNLSIQQAVASAKIDGKICLILPEGLFSNSRDEILRKYIVKYCKILAIVSLPRGAFKKGTSTSQQQKGAQESPQKMSILYAIKIKEIDNKNDLINQDFSKLNYSVFLAGISEPDSKSGPVCDWLKSGLDIVLEQWDEWQKLII